MSIAAVKKARITARIAQSEAVHLPSSSERTQQLLEQAEEKRKLLEKKCEEYDQLCKRMTKITIQKDSQETNHNNLTSQYDEVEAELDKLTQDTEKNVLKQQTKNNEMNRLLQNLAKQHEKEQRLTDDLQKENSLGDELQEKSSEINGNIDSLQQEKETCEKEYDTLMLALDVDSKTEKTLEQYLTRLIDDVFMNQRQLEEMDIGTSRGRASFRQAEKVLREQKRKHRNLTSQLSDLPDLSTSIPNTASPETIEILRNLEQDWYSLKAKMSEMEQRLIIENDKANAQLKEIIKKQKLENEKMKINQQRELALNFDILQHETPMYAAYTSASDLNLNLDRNLKSKNTSRSSSVDESRKTSRSSLGVSITNLKASVFADNLSEDNEHLQMLKNKKQILKTSENEALQQLNDELKRIRSLVSGEKQETQGLDSHIKWLNGSIQTRQADVKFYQNKIDEFMEIAKKEDEAQREAKQKSENATKTQKMTAHLDVEELTYKQLMEEETRNALSNQIKDLGFKYSQMDAQWKTLKSLTKSADFAGAEKLGYELEAWKSRVSEIEENIEKLRKMEDSAMTTNSQFRNNLALLKPYEEEYQEFESLIETNKHLNEQLIQQEKRVEVENVQKRGDIRIYK